PGTGGSSEGTGTILGVLDESTFVSATSSEGTGTIPGVPDKGKVITNEKVIIDWGSEQESEYSEEDQLDDEEKGEKEGDADDEGDDHIRDTQDTNDENDETKYDEDEIYKYKIHVLKNEDEEMLNAEVEDSGKGDAEMSNVTKVDAKKTEEAKDGSKKDELPPTSSNLSVSLGFGDQFLKLSSDTSLIGTVEDTLDANISSLLDIKIQYDVPYIQSSSVLKVHVSVISEPSVLTPVQKTPSAAPVTTLPFPSVSTTPLVQQQTTTPIPTPPIITETLTITTAIAESNALSVVQLRVAKLEKDVSGLKNIDHTKHSEDLIQKHSVKPAPKSSKIQSSTVNLKHGSKKTTLEILKIKREQAEKQKINLANHKLYHALMEALIQDENAMDKGVSDTIKDHKRKHDDDDDDDKDPPAGPNQGKNTKRRLIKELESSKKPSSTKETPKGKAPSKGSKAGKSASAKEPVEEPIAEVTRNPEWFTQPPRPPTPDPEWNKRQAVLDKLDWNNPEGDRYPFDLSKPLPLQGYPGHLTVVADYFFNNDLEYLKSSDLKRTYTTSITKTKAARYEIMGIEDMVPMLWSPTKKILGVKSVSVKKLHGYGHLEEVVVKRSDRQLYTFKEGDFVDLHPKDIEYTLLLAVQHKLFHLNESDLVDFIVALCMFTRSLIIKQLYTPSYKPPGVNYKDLAKHKRVMRADELYKFSNGTLKKVWDELHHRVLDFLFGIQQGDVKEKVDGHIKKEMGAYGRVD
nr:hypothetical protein [Tanacetum cinerariifolium]